MNESRDHDVAEVRTFWENAPLFSGETSYPVGSREYFDEHRAVIIKDCLGGQFDPRTLPMEGNRDKVLDLGCGPGFWSVELQTQVPIEHLVSADLTETACGLAKKRLELNGLPSHVQRENAEELTFPDGVFGHVNCQGVIHHTPNTEACVEEIARVLRPGGTASLSVYYRNVVLRHFRLVRWFLCLLYAAGAKMKGRNREKIYAAPDTDKVVRMYDGAENPIGKAYSRQEFIDMVSPYFIVRDVYFHFFPARSLPFPIPGFLHRFLDGHLPFLIYLNLEKKPSER